MDQTFLPPYTGKKRSFLLNPADMSPTVCDGGQFQGIWFARLLLHACLYSAGDSASVIRYTHTHTRSAQFENALTRFCLDGGALQLVAPEQLGSKGSTSKPKPGPCLVNVCVDGLVCECELQLPLTLMGFLVHEIPFCLAGGSHTMPETLLVLIAWSTHPPPSLPFDIE